MRNKRLISENDLKTILAFILRSGTNSKEFKTELGHYRTPVKTKKEESEVLRAKDKIVNAVDTLLRNNSAQNRKNYENTFSSIFSLAKHHDAPDSLFSLANCE